jgi:hypothetical protein
VPRLRRGELKVVALVVAFSFGTTLAATDAFAADLSHGGGHRSDSHAPTRRPPAGEHIRPPGGNLVVFAPPTPDQDDLRPLCKALLSGRLDARIDHGDGADTVQALIAATGGSRASATAWCLNYLHPHRKHRHKS